jgi:hypothetical protein
MCNWILKILYSKILWRDCDFSTRNEIYFINQIQDKGIKPIQVKHTSNEQL